MADDRDKVVDMDQRIDGLEGGHEEFHREMRGILNSLAESWKVQMDALKDSLQAEIAAIKEEIKEVKGDWSLCKMAGISKPSSPRQSRFDKGRRNGDKPKLSCFLCDGNHFARDCPKRSKLSALIRDDEEEPHQEEAKVGSLRLLDAIKAQVGKSKAPRKGRMYVEAKVRGFSTRALIDTGASHNFIEVKEAKRLGLQLKEEPGWIKAVNTEARSIYGVARGVRLHIGEWCGQVDFTVVPMDDYPIVLGMEFLDGVRAFPIPFAETMCIMGEGSACMVPLAREASKSKTLSAMQLYKEDHSVGLETNAKILAESQGASESAQERYADMAKAAKRRKKQSGKNRRVESLNSKPKDSRDNPRGRDNSCHGSSRQATSTPRENPYGNSWTRAPNFEGRRRGRRQNGWGRMLQAHSLDPKIRPKEGQVAWKSLEYSRSLMGLPEARRWF
ncbi:hypothetical protein Acr_10g0002380 [Actinidia rufa]|uniref:Uncharacterized protein n=1 Tax=Actinidia rufa TaxID=165716 RepID=A0A7J0F8C2_9ERIC|nr:hypothetical protein Acr_10g0002380 [Actinidia rufa]